jgi:NMD protein affecting ribosome stability and mRNA decay
MANVIAHMWGCDCLAPVPCSECGAEGKRTFDGRCQDCIQWDAQMAAL